MTETILCNLVRLFPSSFRERFGAEMEQVIAHGYRRARATGRAHALVYALRTGMAITGNALLAWGELALSGSKTTSLDLRSARRSLLRTPSYSAVMILVVAVSVSIAVVVAAYCRGTLFRDPAYRDPARLVFVWGSNVATGQRRDVVSGPNFLDLRDAGITVESLAAIHGGSAVALRDGRPSILPTLDVSVDFLGVLGVAPALGQDFSDLHRNSTGPDAVIVSHRFWKDHLGGDPKVIGATLPLDGRPHSVVGVLPSDFEFLAPFPLLRPLGEDVLYQEDRTYHNYWMVGRLEPGAAPSDATRELSAVLARVAQDEDPRLLGWSVLVEPLKGVSLEAVRPLLLTLGAAVLLVAIAASLNLATLSLVRTFGRSREIFIRSMLGAGRRGLFRIILLETGALCGLGTGVGLLGGIGLVDALGGIVPAFVPIPGSAANVRVVHAELDTFAVGAAVAVAGVMWVLVALPALLHARALRAGPSVGARATSSQHATRKLVVAELALATLLLVFAGLLDRTATSLLSVDPGVEPAGLLTMYVGQLRDPSPEARARYFRDVVLEVERTPGVVRAGVSDYVPFQGEDDFMGFRLLDRPPPPPGEGLREEWRRVSAGFFEAAGISVRAGRGFEPLDYENPPATAVVNAAFARKYWPHQDVLGKTFEVARPEYGLVEVVGIVEDVRTRGPALPAPPTFFVPFNGQPRNNMGLFVRVSGAPVDFVDAVREAVWAVDSSQPIDRIQTMSSLVDDALALPRLAQSLLGKLASIGLGLAILGLFAVVSYSVRIRRDELGIRLAIGATPLRLQRELVSQVAPLIAFGLAVGSVLGVLSGYAARSLLHGVSPGDPVSIVVAVVVVATAALIAACLPVRTVATIEPALSIRET